MKLTSRRTRRRGGFTLIELLVVIAIIAILVGMAATAVLGILNKREEVTARRDLTQMTTTVPVFMSAHRIELGQPPSRLVLSETRTYGTDQLSKDSVAYLKLMFPGCNIDRPAQFGANDPASLDWNGNGVADSGTVTLDGSQCLVFFLGGIKGNQGFSSNPANPTDNRTSRNGPHYTFEAKRLTTLANGFPVYIDPWGIPYAYFSSYKSRNGYNRYGTSDCTAVSPYLSPGANAAIPTYINPETFQIISAGKDKVFGGGGAVWGPGIPAAGNGADDYANFHGNRLGAP